MAIMDLDLVNTPKENRFDTITKEAIDLLQLPIATITIISDDKNWHKSICGIDECELIDQVSLCEEALDCDGVYIVENTLEDERFRNNPMVINSPFIRFYAGVPLKNRRLDVPVGVFCVKDTKPRKFSAEEVAILLTLAEKAEREINNFLIFSPRQYFAF